MLKVIFFCIWLDSCQQILFPLAWPDLDPSAAFHWFTLCPFPGAAWWSSSPARSCCRKSLHQTHSSQQRCFPVFPALCHRGKEMRRSNWNSRTNSYTPPRKPLLAIYSRKKEKVWEWCHLTECMWWRRCSCEKQHKVSPKLWPVVGRGAIQQSLG